MLSSSEELQAELYKEMKGRIKEDDTSAPYFKNGYWYYTRYEEGKEHAIYCRKEGSLDAQEIILIDENVEAEKHPYYDIVAYSVSKDNSLLAFAEDITGRRMYQLRFKNLKTGEILPHCIKKCRK